MFDKPEKYLSELQAIVQEYPLIIQNTLVYESPSIPLNFKVSGYLDFGDGIVLAFYEEISALKEVILKANYQIFHLPTEPSRIPNFWIPNETNPFSRNIYCRYDNHGEGKRFHKHPNNMKEKRVPVNELSIEHENLSFLIGEVLQFKEGLVKGEVK